MKVTRPNVTLTKVGLVSQAYEDVYFSRDGGISETLYVFIEGCGVLERMKQGESLVIGELGFGSGLNFLTTWLQFRKEKKGIHQKLVFFSTEMHLLERSAHEHLFETFPKLADLKTEFFENYRPAFADGFQHFYFDERSVELVLATGDANEMIPKLSTKVDVWFLDGFSPRRNESLWNEELFKTLASKSKVGTRFSTYSASSKVRIALANAGFSVEKRTGFGSKRQMLYGEYASVVVESADSSPHVTPQKREKISGSGWLQENDLKSLRPHPRNEKVAIIGGGFAGVSVAHLLAREGIGSVVFDEGVAENSCSQNPAAIFRPPTEIQDDLGAQFQLEGYKLLRTSLQDVNDSSVYLNCGVFHCDFVKNLMGEGLEDFWIKDFRENREGHFCKDAGVVNLRKLCEFWVKQSSLISKVGAKVSGVVFKNETDRFLVTLDSGESHEFFSVVFATGIQSSFSSLLEPFHLNPLKGQMVGWNEGKLKALGTVIHTDRYLTPAFNQKNYFGSTFRASVDSREIEKEDAEKLREECAAILEESLPVQDFDWVGIRAASRDTKPIFGKLPDFSSYPEKGSERRYVEGAYVNLALGSKGLVSGMLGASHIVKLITGGALVDSGELLERLLAVRFWLRVLRRK